MRLIKSFCLLLFLLISSFVYGKLPSVGLSFYSHNYNIDKRTSLVLNDEEPYRLGNLDDFTLEFDVFFRDERIKFGYIFRVISNKEENLDFIINNELQMFFVMNNQDFQLKSVPSVNQWNRVVLSFNKKENVISLQYNDEIITCPYELKNLKLLNVSFGQCDFKSFIATDVAPIVLKDVQVKVNDNPLHYWKLDKHGGNVVYDELKNKPAKVCNPDWLMDNRIFWKKITEIKTPTYPQIAFDSITNRIFVLSNKELMNYSIEDDSITVVPNPKETLKEELHNHFIFDPVSKNLLYYGFGSNQKTFYDPVKNIWLDNTHLEEDSDHAHHNRYISKNDSSLYLFGGYGHYRYNSTFSESKLYTNEQKILDFSHTITPRYLAAMGGNRAGNKIYIFGGRGAEMGRQELSPKNFSDLFEVDLQTKKIKYLFDIANEGDDDCVYSNSLVMAEDDKSFYVLAYPNSKYSSVVNLKRINIETQVVENLGNSIEFYFRDVTSFCDLYYSPSLSKLIAIVSYSEDQVSFQINVYTLDCSPLQITDAVQLAPSSTASKVKIAYIFLACLVLMIILFVFGKKWRKNGEKTIPNESQGSIFKANNEETPKDNSFYNFKTKYILFLGGFQVFDKNGKNITGDFTPTLKYLLVLIVLYTMKNNKGISSSKLQELLWFDKPEEAARNNRSVNLRKLRVLLQELGDIDITNQNSYWTISFPDDVFLDYKEVLRLMQKVHYDEITEKDDLLHLLELLNLGILLPNIQFEWVDNFKTDFSNAVIDVLMHVNNNNRNSFYNDQSIQLRIADCILKIDPINEEALSLKCKALYKMGKKGLAKAAFDNFSKEYKLLLGEPYSGSIKNFIN